MKKSLLIAALFFAATLTACGGGGGTTEPEPVIEQPTQQEREIEKLLADVEVIRKKIAACQCEQDKPFLTRPDVVSDEDLQTLLKYGYYLLDGENHKMAQALIKDVNYAIEYRKQMAEGVTSVHIGQTQIQQESAIMPQPQVAVQQ